jgi:hypothetical protein
MLRRDMQIDVARFRKSDLTVSIRGALGLCQASSTETLINRISL